MKQFTYLCNYLFLRAILFPFTLLSYKFLHKMGGVLGTFLFYALKRYRKRILSNLSLSNLSLSELEKKTLAKESLGNLITTCLEYGKLSREKNIHSLVTCVNPEEANAILAQGKGLIFLCGHQANWELFFLEGTSRMPGVAIGQPIKNGYLYRWILSIREKFGGTIVLPEQAVKEGLRALKQGKFLGIVGDQGMPTSGFKSLFLGREAWTSPLPGLLSYRTGAPLITATMRRENGHYFIHYSQALWPDKAKPMEVEIPSLMRQALLPLEESIRKHPSEWLWAHNRWKQQPPGKIKKKYRQDAIGVILPEDKTAWETLAPQCKTFREIYPTELLVFFTPFPLIEKEDVEEVLYEDLDHLLSIRDYRCKLVFNLTPHTVLSSHFLHLATFHVITLTDLAKESHHPTSTALSHLLKGAIFHAG